MSTTLFSGSLQPTLNTVHLVGTLTAGIYTFQTDLGQMINGEDMELGVNSRIGAGTVSSLYLASYSGRQSTVKASPPFVISNSGHVAICKRTSTGTGWIFYETLAI